MPEPQEDLGISLFDLGRAEEACLNYYETALPERSGSVDYWKRHEDKHGELIEMLGLVRDRYRRYE